EDDGRSNDYKQGKVARTALSCDDRGAKLAVKIDATVGDYEGKLVRRTYILKINRKVENLRGVLQNDEPMQRMESAAAFESTPEGWFNDAEHSIVWVKFA